jgi:hypothetical protein
MAYPRINQGSRPSRHRTLSPARPEPGNMPHQAPRSRDADPVVEIPSTLSRRTGSLNRQPRITPDPVPELTSRRQRLGPLSRSSGVEAGQPAVKKSDSPVAAPQVVTRMTSGRPPYSTARPAECMTECHTCNDGARRLSPGLLMWQCRSSGRRGGAAPSAWRRSAPAAPSRGWRDGPAVRGRPLPDPARSQPDS